MNLSIYPSINPSIHLSIYPPIHLSTYPSIRLSTCLSLSYLYPPIHISIYLPLSLSYMICMYVQWCGSKWLVTESVSRNIYFLASSSLWPHLHRSAFHAFGRSTFAMPTLSVLACLFFPHLISWTKLSLEPNQAATFWGPFHDGISGKTCQPPCARKYVLRNVQCERPLHAKQDDYPTRRLYFERCKDVTCSSHALSFNSPKAHRRHTSKTSEGRITGGDGFCSWGL